MHIYPWQMNPNPLLQSSIDLWKTLDTLNTVTPNLAGLPPGQSSIDALNTVTPNLADLMADQPPNGA